MYTWVDFSFPSFEVNEIDFESLVQSILLTDTLPVIRGETDVFSKSYRYNSSYADPVPSEIGRGTLTENAAYFPSGEMAVSSTDFNLKTSWG